ncbi:alpha-mannosidase [Nostoc cycadae]|uniref:Alpha-mannosidase n=1 Tax=Nostoc cycadae WK-1 TaxID=1861711 RepID=A0A2H6LHQ1_9NOSO|nr:alpha-mannosidase [Nostoc cycadae]GBE92703.1 alpha-mannosidase [Nostoc cycadae WK-1]
MTPPVSQSQTNLISETIEQLRSCCQVNLQSTWLYQECDRSITDVVTSNLSDWQPVELNAKGHIAWQGGKQVLWLVQKLVVPQDLQGYSLAGLSLRLALIWWADAAEVYVNGELVQAGDLFDFYPRVLLSQSVSSGDEFIVALRLVSPGHDNGALMRSLLIYESTDYNHPDPGFVADELAVTQLYLEKFAPERLDGLAAEIERITNRIRREAASQQVGAKDTKEEREEWEKCLLSVRQKLFEFKIHNLKFKINLLGHAHLDLAWLWPVNETWNAAQNTFESVLKLQKDFPELIFCHSTPALYAWVEEHRPDLFAAIQQAVAAGTWEIIGATWVEPELNLISGESIVRQLLYGQRYFQEKFGKISPIVWVPDSFGFCATLPQFFVNAGVEYFVTQKLRWNDTTKFDYGAFWWRSPDGSQVFSLMSAPVGEGIDPVKMAAYTLEWQAQTNLQASLWLPGVGDHGGGPTRDMLEIAQRWQNSPVFPELEFTTAEKYLQQINQADFPTWDDELYLEFHRGCYTTHADQKRWNRYSENLLYQAELFATLATIICGATSPKAEIEKAWKQVLFNQFHDVLPGSSITQVYTDALPEWQQVEQVGTRILVESMQAIASHFTLPEPPEPNSLPIFVFNSLNWQRSEVVAINLPTANPAWQIYDVAGNQIISQLTQPTTLLFLATDIPSVGYRLFWLVPASQLPSNSPSSTTDFVLENQFLRVVIDPDTGDLSSVLDKNHQREVLSGAGNQLQAFKDSGQYWDAWNIDPNYAQHPLPATSLKSIQVLEQGPVQHRLRVVRQLGESEFRQDYILQAGSPLLKIATTVNWQENQVFVKAAFPLNVEADFATYEIPCGAIRRPTKPQTPPEQAKWEVPALRWADLTGETEIGIYGVSLLNDCKYGYDAQHNQLRLSLLRSPNWPDPECDRGFHEFTYALYPHANTWESAQTVQRGYELNIPLQVFSPQNSKLSTQHSALNENLRARVPRVEQSSITQHSALNNIDRISFLNLTSQNLILMALKPTEDNPQEFILRCYESQGKTAELCLQSDLDLLLGEKVDLLESSLDITEFSVRQQPLTIHPGKIITVKLISASNPQQK